MREFPKFATPDRAVPARESAEAAPGNGVIQAVEAEIRQRFGHSVNDLRGLLTAAPDTIPGASEVVRWFDQLAEAQQFLDDAESALADVLVEVGEQPLNESQMDVARTVDAAVAVRDGRALVVRFLLDPEAAGKRSAVTKGEALGLRRRPALTASVPPRPAAPAAAGVRR